MCVYIMSSRKRKFYLIRFLSTHRIYLHFPCTFAFVLTSQILFPHPDICRDRCTNALTCCYQSAAIELIDRCVLIQILTKDKKTSTCICKTDPHCLTLDRQLLGRRAYYNHYLLGDFVMYRSTVRVFEVQIRTWTCGHRRATCICAATMREGNDVITIDLCHGSFGHSFPKMTIQHQGQLSQGTNVHKDANGKTWMVSFPSGAWVKVVLDRKYMNVIVQAPEDDYGATQGLCGTFNSLIDDDLTRKDGIVANWTKEPTNFIESWRIPSGDSHNMHDTDVKIDPKLNNDLYFCNCASNKTQVDCKISYRATGPAISSLCNQCQKVTPGTGHNVHHGRRRRQSTYVDSDQQSANNYDVGLFFTPHVPNFPTPSGRTEAQTRQICSDTLQRYPVVRQCNTLVNLTFHGEIENCVEDIKISDDVSWAMSSLNAAVMSCMEVVLKDPSFYVTNAVTGEPEPPAFITSDVCPNHCSGHGTCHSGTCTCDAHYVDYDCSIDSSKPPPLHGIVSTNKNTIDSDQCDIQARPCKLVYVIGDNIQNSSHLSCRLNVLAYDGGVFRPTGQTINVGVEFKTMYHIGCKMPLRTSVNGHTIVGYNISITNDGRHYGNEVQVFKMDSDCMTCHTMGGACHAKANTCVIDGRCLLENTTKDGQPDMMCMPGISQYSWTSARGTTNTTVTTTSLPPAPVGGNAMSTFDIWTLSTTGCQCGADHSRHDCACCDVGACRCPGYNHQQCVQCGKPANCGTPQPAPDNGVDGYTLVMNDCTCAYNTTLYNCACCQYGGCQCPSAHRNQCVLCGHMHTCGAKPWLFGPALP